MDTVRNLFYRFVWNALALFLLAKWVYSGRVEISGLWAAAVVVFLLALAQAFVRPALFLLPHLDLSTQPVDIGLGEFRCGTRPQRHRLLCHRSNPTHQWLPCQRLRRRIRHDLALHHRKYCRQHALRAEKTGTNLNYVHMANFSPSVLKSSNGGSSL